MHVNMLTQISLEPSQTFVQDIGQATEFKFIAIMNFVTSFGKQWSHKHLSRNDPSGSII